MVTMGGIEEDLEVIVNVKVDGDVKSEDIQDIVIEENVEVKEDTLNAVEDSVCCDSFMQVGCFPIQRAKSPSPRAL